MLYIVLGLYLLSRLLLPFLVGHLARQAGRSALGWAVAAVLFPYLALFYLVTIEMMYGEQRRIFPVGGGKGPCPPGTFRR